MKKSADLYDPKEYAQIRIALSFQKSGQDPDTFRTNVHLTMNKCPLLSRREPCRENPGCLDPANPDSHHLSGRTRAGQKSRSQNFFTGTVFLYCPDQIKRRGYISLPVLPAEILIIFQQIRKPGSVQIHDLSGIPPNPYKKIFTAKSSRTILIRFGFSLNHSSIKICTAGGSLIPAKKEQIRPSAWIQSATGGPYLFIAMH